MSELVSLGPLARPAALREQIHERLRSAILTGELPPGTPMVEAEVAAQLGASRTPVREALRRLESEGLLVPRGGRGTVVRSLEADDVACLFEIRQALEVVSARRAARAIDDEALARLQATIDGMRESIDDPNAMERFDTAFHDELLRVAGGAKLTRMLTELREETIAYRFLSLGDEQRRRETLAEHTAILDALRARDSEAATRAIGEHIAAAGAVVARRATSEPRRQDVAS
jgi:DNA-binding GntR family transcriptional regulator